jgi:hypothetical protein
LVLHCTIVVYDCDNAFVVETMRKHVLAKI